MSLKDQMKSVCLKIRFLLLSLIFTGFFSPPGFTQDSEATIDIDLSIASDHAIPPEIYGGFIEFIGSTINRKTGLWAQEIDYRGFEAEDTVGNGVAGGWLALKEGNNTCTWTQDTVRFNMNGSYSQKIDATQFTSGRIGIIQSEITFQGRELYDLSLYLRGSGLNSSVTIWLLEDTTGWQISDSVSISGIDQNWTRFDRVMMPLNSTQEGFFAITFQAEGTLWIDEVSFTPKSAIDGVRKAYVDLTQILKPNIMRYPGGSFADGEGNHWMNGIGEMTQRPPNWDNYFEKWQRLDFGTDEFVQYCRNTGMDPQITVNFGSGTPEEAADWVEYMNGDISTPFGQMRADNGHTDPYGVTYWEIGNEQYRDLAIGHTSAENYGQQFITYTNLMKSVDPTIKTIANGCRYDQSWNDTLLTVAGAEMDYISLHLTCPDLSDNASGHTDEEVYYAVVAGPLKHKRALGQLKQMIDTLTPGQVRFAITELWMTFGRNPLYGHHDNTVETVLYIASLLNQFQHNPFVDIANWTTAGKIKYSTSLSTFYKTAAFHALSLYSNYSGSVPIPSAVVCSTYTSPRVGSFDTMDSVPYLDVSVTREDNHVFVNTVNRSLKDIPATITITGESILPTAIVRTVNGSDFLSSNRTFPHDEVTLSESYLSGIEQSFDYTFIAHSVTGIELTTSESSVEEGQLPVKTYALKQNYPNPFNPTTTISFELPVSGKTTVKIYNLLGNEIVNLLDQNIPAGKHQVVWNGKDATGRQVGSGVYIYCIESGEFTAASKMILMR